MTSRTINTTINHAPTQKPPPAAENETRLMETRNPLILLQLQSQHDEDTLFGQDINNYNDENNRFNADNSSSRPEYPKEGAATFISLLCHPDPLVLSAEGQIIRRVNE